MKTITELKQELNELESQKQNFKSIDKISIMQFLKYKRILTQKEKIFNKLEKNITMGKAVDFWYNESTKSWIENPSINCRKYYNMEKNAAYKKDLKLYQLGLINKKPSSPFIQYIKMKFRPIKENINTTIEDFKRAKPQIKLFKLKISDIKVPKIKLPKISNITFINSFRQKYNSFITQTLPQKTNSIIFNLVVSCLKITKNLKDNYTYLKNFLYYKKSFKYMRNMVNIANSSITNNTTYQKKNEFKDSLKVSPENIVFSDKKVFPHQKVQSMNNHLHMEL